jgi:O-antigen/teichoic acid export membrane protein
MVSSSLNTRFLGPNDFGIYATVLAVSDFVLLFIDFGLFSSTGRIIALKDDLSKSRQLVGALVLLTIILALISAAILFGLSFIIDKFIEDKIGNILRIFCVFIGLSLFQMSVESICRGSNHIEKYSLYNVLSRIIFISLILLFFYLGYYNNSMAILFNFLAVFLSSVVIINTFIPSLSNFTGSMKDIFKDMKEYGFKAYMGNIASTGSYRTDKIMLSYFSGSTVVGYYHLGNLLTFPMVNFSRSLATSLYKKFALSNSINRKVLIVNFLWLFFCCIGIILFGRYIITMLFGNKYEPVEQLIFPLALTSFFAGLSIPYNMYLGASGKGSYLRNTAFTTAFFNILLNIILIPRYHALGACYASLIAMIINMVIHRYYYLKTVHGNLTNELQV